MLPNYQARSPFVLKHTYSMYICVYGWYVCPLNARAGNFYLLKTRLFWLDPETTALNKPYFKLKLLSMRKFRRKPLFFKTQKVSETGYYGIEDTFPNVISKIRHFRGIRSAACLLSRAIGSQNAIMLMLRKLLLLK